MSRHVTVTPTQRNTPPRRLTAWQAHTSAVTALEHIEHEHGLFLISCSADCTARLWTVHGHFVGTFGQETPWDLGELSSMFGKFVA